MTQMGCAVARLEVDSGAEGPARSRCPRPWPRSFRTALGNQNAPRAAAGEQGEAPMAKKSKTGVLKRLREVKKAEKAALKREELRLRKEMGPGPASAVVEKSEPKVATADDLAGYGFPVAGEEGEADEN